MIVIAIGVWVKVLFSKDVGGIYYDADTLLIYKWFYESLSSTGFHVIPKIITFFLVLLQAVLINGIINQNNLIGVRSYLPGIFFIIISANFIHLQQFHPIVFANLFLLLSWERLSSVSEKSNALKAFFQASLSLGIASLFYPNYSYFIILILLGTILNRISNAKEVFMVIIGFVAAWYFYFSIIFLSSGKINLAGLEAGFVFSFSGIKDLPPGVMYFLFFLGVLLLMANFQLSTYLVGVKINIRRNFKILFGWFVIAACMFLFTKSSTEIVYPLAIPVSIIFTVLFSNINKKWLADLLWGLLLAFTIYNQIM